MGFCNNPFHFLLTRVLQPFTIRGMILDTYIDVAANDVLPISSVHCPSLQLDPRNLCSLTIQVGSCVLSLVWPRLLGLSYMNLCLGLSKHVWNIPKSIGTWSFRPIKVTIEFCCAPFFGPTSHGKTKPEGEGLMSAAKDLVVDEFGAYTIWAIKNSLVDWLICWDFYYLYTVIDIDWGLWYGEIYQPTSILSWDRGIFYGSLVLPFIYWGWS